MSVESILSLMSKVNRFSLDFTMFFTEEYPNFAKFTVKDLT